MTGGPHIPTPGVRQDPGSDDYEGPPELEGAWQAKDVEDETASTDFVGPTFDSADWTETTSPTAPRSGVRRFRKTFETQAEAGRRYWLAIDPLQVDTSVWLDGSYIGDAERSVVSKLFDVTQAIARTDEHLLALQMTALGEPMPTPAHVRIFDTGKVCITRMKALCVEATENSALLDMWAELDSHKPVEVTVRTAVEGVDDPVLVTRHLSTGRNRLHWTVQVDDPPLWWPRNYGAHPLRHVEVTVIDETHKHTMSDARLLSVGFRSVRRHGQQLVVNGERTNVRAVEAGRDFDIDSVASGINTLLVSEAGMSGRLLNNADKLGLMVIAHASSDPRRARQSVEAYGAHPSLVAWRSGRPHLASVRVGQGGQAARSITRSDPSRPIAPIVRHIDTIVELDDARSREASDGFVVSSAAMAACHLVRVVVELRDVKSSQRIDVYIVNDSREDITDGVISLAVQGISVDTGSVRKSWGGAAPAGTVTFIGALTLPLLEARSQVDIEVSLLSPGLALTRAVQHTTGTDGMILDVMSPSPNLAARSASAIARRARSVGGLARARRARRTSNSDHTATQDERQQ